MDATTNTTSDLEGRIAQARRRLAADQNLQLVLDAQRAGPLESGDDVALDQIEQQLAECIKRQERSQERIALFEQRLSEDNQ